MKIYQKDNEVIVSQLRPMSDAPRDGTDILLMSKTHKLFNGCNYGILNDNFVLPGIGSCKASVFIGWLPMPQYRPELKPVDK